MLRRGKKKETVPDHPSKDQTNAHSSVDDAPSYSLSGFPPAVNENTNLPKKNDDDVDEELCGRKRAHHNNGTNKTTPPSRPQQFLQLMTSRWSFSSPTLKRVRGKRRQYGLLLSLLEHPVTTLRDLISRVNVYRAVSALCGAWLLLVLIFSIVPSLVRTTTLRDQTRRPRVLTRIPASTTDPVVDLRHLTATLAFDNPDGGVWKQGWPLQPRTANRFHPVHIIVVPHTHCDPGWIKTFDEYFLDQVKEILTSVIEGLLRDTRRTFIWAEMSYFAWWWHEQSQDVRDSVRDLLDRRQLEFVTGGWVQPDEANSQYYALDLQMQVGHDWIREHLGEQYLPKYGWSIDPFGYSPTLAYLLQHKYAFQGLVIQRVHYAVKRYLAQHQHLEFYWRQTWDSSGQHDILTHLMPFYSYDIPHTCGPDPKICCRFDFPRWPLGDGPECPWGEFSEQVNATNVQSQALTLLDQYLKKASLYRSNTVLIPLGDDFRYQSPHEVELQFSNHQRLHDYINEHVPGVTIQFGTLADYFEAIHGTFRPPILKGSFFTYSDVNQDYWSGYYTSRVFDKALDRKLERVLYATEQLGIARDEVASARRELALFQHHDGVTGTATDLVVEDYAQRLHTAIRSTQSVMLQKLQAVYPQEFGAFPNVEACWKADAPRILERNLCGHNHGSILLYNPLSSIEQTCGSVVVPGGAVKLADLPCEVTGPTSLMMSVPSSTFNVVFDQNGLMVEPVREEWKFWNVTSGGAYLFHPDHLMTYDLHLFNLSIQDNGYVVETPFWKRTIIVKEDGSAHSNAIAIDFIFETLLLFDNQEWFVRFGSKIRNQNIFHTDLNGFNFDTHIFRPDMPIQSQVFPMPTLACIEDDKQRMTILSEHAQGTASLLDGTIDIMLDRRLSQDDERGMGQGVQDNRRTRTRLRLILESGKFKNNVDEFDISPFTRSMWEQLQHPLEMFGSPIVPESPAHEDRLQRAALNRERAREIRREQARQHSSSLSTFTHTIKKGFHMLFKFSSFNTYFRGHGATAKSVDYYNPTETVIPFVFMVHKRVAYFAKAIESLRKSDFPKTRVPIIISHDGHVPEMLAYVNSLKTEFKVIQIFHPDSCYEHPNSFPGNDMKLNIGFKGDSYGHPRSGWATCCKHHFTWMLKTVFNNLDLDLNDDDDKWSSNVAGTMKKPRLNPSVDTYMFLEEDYVLAPTIYTAVINGLNVMKAFEQRYKHGLFGLCFDPTVGNAENERTNIPDDVWYARPFHSGPFTMHRNMFRRIEKHAATFCRFDDYNWDWSLVHLQGLGLVPHTILYPAHILAKHIGIKSGMHHNDGESSDFPYGPGFYQIDTHFAGRRLYFEGEVEPVEHEGYGGWSHPADQEHCMRLLQSDVEE